MEIDDIDRLAIATNIAEAARLISRIMKRNVEPLERLPREAILFGLGLVFASMFVTQPVADDEPVDVSDEHLDILLSFIRSSVEGFRSDDAEKRRH